MPIVASFSRRLSRCTLSRTLDGTPNRLGPVSSASAVRNTTQSLPLLPTATCAAGAAADTVCWEPSDATAESPARATTSSMSPVAPT